MERNKPIMIEKKLLSLVSISFLLIASLHITPVIARDEIPTTIKQMLLRGDFSNASQALRLLSAENNLQAKYQLAILYLNGKGIKRAPHKAKKLLTVAAEQLPEAAFLLGSLYYKGNQIEGDKQLAKRYLTKAASMGNRRADKMLKKITREADRSGRVKPQTQRLFALAVSGGNLSFVIKQYLNGAKLNHPNDAGDTPIITAIKLDRSEVLLWLIQQKVNLTIPDKSGNTALHVAATHGQLKSIIAMSKQLKNIDLVNASGRTPLITAVIAKQKGVAQWLLNKGANMHLKDAAGKSAFDYNKTSNLALLENRSKISNKKDSGILAKKQLDHQLILLKKQVKNKSSPYFNWPLLPIAVAQDQTDLANYLLQQGSSPWQKASDDKTAISIALEKGNTKLLSSMTRKFPIKANGTKASIETLFFLAIEKDNKQLLTSILRRAKSLGLNGLPDKGLLKAVKQQNLDSTLLFLKIKQGPIDSQLVNLSITSDKNAYKITKLLLERGLSANTKNSNGQTPLVLSAKHANVTILSLLVKRKIDVNETDTQGLTALMWASKQGCLECVQVLLKHNAKVDIKSRTGNTALMLSSANNQTKIISLLLTTDPELKIRNGQSFTALMLAVTKNCLGCVNTLLAKGANPKRKNAFGLDSFALAKNNPKIHSLLLEN